MNGTNSNEDNKTNYGGIKHDRHVQFKIKNSIRSYQLNEKEQIKDFIKQNFHSVDCRHFVENKISDGDRNRCFCGQMKNNHKKDKSPYNISSIWTEKICMEVLPTESFGKIEFRGEYITNTKLTEFVRLSYQDDLNQVLNLMFNYWNIEIGTLCISVIGGSRTFKMRTKKENIFCQGLIKAVKTTNALIMTSGLNFGISRIVGDALQNGQSYLYDKTKHNNFICCLGISPWGNVKNNLSLERAKGQIIQYQVSSEIRSDPPIPLNKNHTHYLFVDDGNRLKFSTAKIAKFRADLQRMITQKTNEREGIPAVLLIVDGDHDALVEASRCVKDNVSIVICEGTGRASDILGEAFREMQKTCDKILRFDGVPMLPNAYKISLMKKLVEKNVSEVDQVDEAISCIEIIIQKEYLITLFDMNEDQSLDNLILYSLIKKMDFVSDSDENITYNQLSYCLKWNRVDIAKDKIFSRPVSFSEDEWTALLKEAIISGKVDFVKLFLNNGAAMQDFLTKDILNELYEECPRSVNFRNTIFRILGKNFSKGLLDVRKLLSKIFGEFNCPWFTTDDEITHPFQELFIWSVLMEKHESADFFWEKTEESLCLALVATKLYQILSATSPLDTDRVLTLKVWKDYFENLAVKLLEECYEADQEATAYIIEKENLIWGGQTCLEIAYKANDLKFISCIVCQNSIDFTWRAGFSINSFQCILCIFCPFLIFNPSFDNSLQEDLDKVNNESKEDDLIYRNNFMSKIVSFYKAPQTKFCIHTVTFMVFVAYFSFVVLFGMKRFTLTIHEIIFTAYILCMIVENVLMIFNSKLTRFGDKIKFWWHFNIWNKLDLLIVIFFLIGLLLRLRLVFSIAGDDKVMIYRCQKTFYSIIVGYFYLKFLHLMNVHKKLGPKIFMISKMFQELILYLVIIFTIILACGVIIQGSYYPQRDFSLETLPNIVDYQYWTVFGELTLDELVYLSFCDATTNYNVSQDCAEENYFIPFVYAAYSFFSNTLMIPLLIAVFNYIFHKIHSNSIEVWKFTMYSLVMEYNMKPILPLPFSILVYIYNILSYFYRRYKKHHQVIDEENEIRDSYSYMAKKNPKSDNLCSTLTMPLESEVDKLVKYFENTSQKCVVKDLILEKEQSIEAGILRLESRLKTVSTIIKNIDAKFENIALIENKDTSPDKPESLNSQFEFKSLDSAFEERIKETNMEVLEFIDNLRKQKIRNNNSTTNDYENHQSSTDIPLQISQSNDTNEDWIKELQTQDAENIKRIESLDQSLDEFKLEMETSLKNIVSFFRQNQN